MSKSAMQELRETIWAMIENGGTEEDLFAVIAHIDKALEKEKEQIVAAREDGNMFYLFKSNEQYLKQTYNN
jgi:hypothetical protein